MWNLGKRDIIVLVSVISGCAILCNVFGPFYAITVILVLIICGFCIIVANDTPFTPRALIIYDYLQLASREINVFVENSYLQTHVRLTEIANTLKRLYRVYVVEIMAQRRRNTYQLSAENYSTSVNSKFGLVAGISPITRRTIGLSGPDSNEENSPYVDADSRILERSSSMSKITSTPMVPWRKEEVRNGDIFGTELVAAARSPWSKSEAGMQNHTLSRGEDVAYSTKSSPWGNSISPKMRSRAGGVKTVQTVAGPLLASTKYNIDTEIYTNVTSPGFASRLTKYAAEASAKLGYQPQYGTGQFPRVNLNASPTPLMNPRTGRMRTPVTVRVAPPENSRYSPPERQKILSDICRAEDETSPSVFQVLKEISLKRHASPEDVTFDFAKKQRTDGVFADDLENLEEMTQKRTRDDSSRSEEEISPQNKSVRPAKRTKMPSCHDILSSLSSSIVVSSGTKRKAIDTSRSGTPEIGKHFKSLDSSQGDVFVPTIPSRTISEQAKATKRSLNDLETSRSFDLCSPQKKWSEPNDQNVLEKPHPGKRIIENEIPEDREKSNRPNDDRDVRNTRENATTQPQTGVKLNDRLFMKAEPQNIDKLKTLIEEHGSIKPRFLTNESDEIKKSDIVNMRQTSMKTRLKSMFDAISGKAPSAINPEVVIQAEEAKSPTLSTIPTSLSSSTSTTSVNTSPIAISAIVPIIGKTKPTATPGKHVRFQFAAAESTIKTGNVEPAKTAAIETKITNNLAETKESVKTESQNVVVKNSDATKSIFQTFNSPTTTSAVSTASTFSFGSSSLNAISSATTNLKPSPAVASMNSISVTSTPSTKLVNSPPQFNSTQLFNVSALPTSVSDNSMSGLAKSTPGIQPNSSTTTTQASDKISQPSGISFSFGNPTTSVNAPASVQSGLFASTPSQSFTAPATTSTTSTGSSLFGIPNKTTTVAPTFGATTVAPTFGATTVAPTFGATTVAPTFGATAAAPTFGATTVNNTFAGVPTPATTSAFTFGATATPQTTEKKPFTFGPATIAPTQTNPGSTETSQAAATPIVAPTPVTTGFSFSANNVATINNARSTSNPALPAATTTATAIFSFGSNPAVTSKPTFAFASSTTNTSATMPKTVTDTVTFGTTNNTSTPLFGAQATVATTTTSAQPSLFGIPATSTSGFPTTTQNSTFGTTTGQSTFAVTANPTFGVAKTMESTTFGTNSNVPPPPPSFAASSTASSLFSGSVNSNATAATTTPAPAFGTPRFGEAKPPPPAFGANPTPNFPPTSGTSLFGSQPTSNPPTFGTSNSSTTGNATSLFGTPNASGQTFGTTGQTFGTPNTAPPAFGATNSTTTTFGTPTTSAPAFGTIGASAPSFGQQSTNVNATGVNQNSTNSAFNAASPSFGATTTAPPPAFGTSAATSTAFGNSATSGFGTPSQPPPAFSSANTSFSGFGGSNNAASPFAAQPAVGTLSFGNTNSSVTNFSANSGNTGSFGFGANQTAAQQPQQTASFAFGGGSAAANANAASGSAPFQFGNAAAPQSGGFNFSGAPSAPALNFSRDGTSGAAFPAPAPGANAFNAPTTGGGMFSIGSGSTGPRSRPSRRRQR